ncbi:MAG TPA: carbamate kinase [Stellaceae bacterium]|nr:carbamate kinase [Stellaceae bacterium]
MRVVLALGGNALLRRGEPLEAGVQRRNIAIAVATAVAPIARKHDVIITHGNGPQVGLLALQAAAYPGVRPYPLDVLGAETEGMIGYLIEAALAGALPGRELATLLTQIEVDPDDPAFRTPEKPIGPIYDDIEARRLEREIGWPMMRDGTGWRRAVPSPAPKRIREISTIKLLLRSGVIVICAGGGGIPVVATPHGIEGVEAVIDKDFSAGLLARSLDADALLLLTDVAAVWSSWPAKDGRPIGRTTPAALRQHRFAPGSMAPKVEAACQFVEMTGRMAGIGSMEEAEAILDGRSGTIIAPP